MASTDAVKVGSLEFLAVSKLSSSWKKHYIKVTKDGRLQCFKDEKMTKLREERRKEDMKDIQVLQFPKGDIIVVNFHDKKHETWQLKAFTKNEQSEWITALSSEVSPAVPTTDPQKHAQSNVQDGRMATYAPIDPYYHYQPYRTQSVHMPRPGAQRQPIPPPYYPTPLYPTHMPVHHQCPPYPVSPAPLPMPRPCLPNNRRTSYTAEDLQPVNRRASYAESVSPLQTSASFDYPNSPPYPTIIPAPYMVPENNGIPDSGYVTMTPARSIGPNTTQHEYDYVIPPQSGNFVPKLSDSGVFRSASISSNASSISDGLSMMSISEPKIDFKREISESLLSNVKLIGKGNFGEVFLADYKISESRDPIKVAVKTLKNAKPETREEMLKEFAVMATIVHPNIVRLYGVVEDSISPRIVIEYFPNGDLKTYLKNSPTKPVDTLVKYMVDVAMGMHYIAQKGLIHRDLAARNVLVGEGESCKVADFGLVRELPPDRGVYESQTQVPLPIRWMPPEAISDRKFSEASDVWSFGVLQWEMFNPHSLPYGSMSNLQVSLKVAEGHRLSTPEGCPSVIADIMTACWHSDPSKRPTFHYITTILTTRI